MKLSFLIIFLSFLIVTNVFAQQYTLNDVIDLQKSGKDQESIVVLEKLIEKVPENSDYWFYLGLAQRRNGEFDKAHNSQNIALQISPNYTDAKIELARVLMIEGDHDGAKLLLAGIADDDRYGAAVRDLRKKADDAILAKNKKGRSGDDFYKYQLDTGYEYSGFRRVKQAGWRHGFINLNYKLKKDRLIHVKMDHVSRFKKYNRHFEVGFASAFGKNYYASLDVGRTPNEKLLFLPSWRVRASGEVRLVRDLQSVGDLWFLADYQNDKYETLAITVEKYGLRYHLTDRLFLQGKGIKVEDRDNKPTYGWSSRLTWYTPHEPLRVAAGLSSAPETENAIIIETRAKFVSFSYDITKRLTWHNAYTREDRENSFIRKVYSSAISIKF